MNVCTSCGGASPATICSCRSASSAMAWSCAARILARNSDRSSACLRADSSRIALRRGQSSS